MGFGVSGEDLTDSGDPPGPSLDHLLLDPVHLGRRPDVRDTGGQSDPCSRNSPAWVRL